MNPEQDIPTQAEQNVDPGLQRPEPLDVLQYEIDQQATAMSNTWNSLAARKQAQAKRQELQATFSALGTMLEGEDPLAIAHQHTAPIEHSRNLADKKTVAAFSRAKEFLRGHSEGINDSMEKDSGFQEWLGKRARSKEEVERAKLDEMRRDEVKASLASIDSAHEKLKRIEQERIINGVLETSGVDFHTDLPAELSQSGYTGFSSINSNRLDGARNATGSEFELLDEPGQGGRDKIFTEQGIQEGVLIRPMTEPDYQDVEVEKRGRFGKKTIEKERKFVGTKQQKMSDVVGGGGNEPAVEIVYTTFSNPNYKNEDTVFKTCDGRDGNLVKVSIAMPKNLAEELTESAMKDPKIMRKLVDKIALQRVGVPEDAWYSGNDQTNGRQRRPPHEAWQKYHGGKSKMYFKNPDDRKIEDGTVVEFRG